MSNRRTRSYSQREAASVQGEARAPVQANRKSQLQAASSGRDATQDVYTSLPAQVISILLTELW